MNDLDTVIEGNYKALARSLVFDPFTLTPGSRSRQAIVWRLTDAICKRAYARKWLGL